MPLCPSDQPAPTRAPDAAPSAMSKNACRARVTAVQRVRGVVPAPGYHHLGATTAGKWSGVLGRVEVVDPGVRADTFEFVAARFMAKADVPGGVAWLEAGWAETGWAGGGRQRMYSYDTNRQSWIFFDEYRLKPGDRLWIYVQTEQDGDRPAWQAWLWWADKWNLLSSQSLPIGARATIEQYVEVHAERPIDVPGLRMDSASVKDGPTGGLTYWDEPTVATNPGVPAGGYCLTWATRYNSWTAGSCA